MSIMVRMRETIDSFDVVGLPLRTSNREAARTIPPHWRAAADAGLLAPEKPGVGPGIYAVYTDYETPGDDATASTPSSSAGASSPDVRFPLAR